MSQVPSDAQQGFMNMMGQGESVGERVFESELGFKSRDGSTHSVADMRVLGGEVDHSWPVRHDNDIRCCWLDRGDIGRRGDESVKSIGHRGIRV